MSHTFPPISRTRAIIAFVALALVAGAAAFLYSSHTVGTTYVDPGHRFSVELPPGATAQDSPSADRSVDTLEFSDKQSDNVQVTITPWSGPDTLTKEAVAHDYPWIESDTVEPAQVAASAGIAFNDADTGGQDLWFTSGGYLYQAVEQGGDGTLLQTLAATWRFNN